MRFYVAGSSGFVGRALCHELEIQGHTVTTINRVKQSGGLSYDDLRMKPDLLLEADVFVHLAGLAHGKFKGSPTEEVQAFYDANVSLAVEMAHLVYTHSKARFVLVSSVAVYGLESCSSPIDELTPTRPATGYGKTKLKADQEIKRLAQLGGGNFTIIRPPMVYGAGAPANFGRLERLAKTSLPLPFLEATARRSTIGVRSLAHFIIFSSLAPAAQGQTYVVAEHEVQTLRDLVSRLRSPRPNLFAVPAGVMHFSLSVLGRRKMANQLFKPLVIDDAKARALGWVDPYDFRENMADLRKAEKVSSRRSPLPASAQAYLPLKFAVGSLMAATALVLLMPIMVAVALLIYVDDPGPVLFKQERAGRWHRPFSIYKFRTMKAGTPHLSTEEMRRLGLSPYTRLGPFLRRTSLDELPQLINVLRGEMSLVGPRPALLSQTRVLRAREVAGVEALRPGITGLAQVSGRDDLSDEEKVERDKAYLEAIGPLTDLMVLMQTVKGVLGSRGAY